MTRYDEIYEVVRRIPPGKVTTYGRVAQLAGVAGQARLVGYALHALRLGASTHSSHDEVPWWRVVNAQRYISNRYEPALQRILLEQEGVLFDEQDHIDFAQFLWRG